MALAKILEGWAVCRMEQLEGLRVQTGLQMQALVAGGGEAAAARQNTACTAVEDEAQAFLEAFEVAVEAGHWPREEWVVHLLPLLSGEAQQAAYSLPPSARNNYQNIRKAVLDRTGRFRNLVLAARLRTRSGERTSPIGSSVHGGRCGTGGVGEVCGRDARCHSDLGELSSALQPQCRHHPRRGPYGPMPTTTPRREARASPTVEVPSSRCISCCGPGANIYPS